ncbi:hypothetical protein [Streptomyces sp. NRRL F-5681]|uniref:hypothetical protein n=1 Tax=Streptomyces sp. NRRL F-5681 TaxID=1463869 RepID=UPI0004BF0A50|nr:hypothetical protein [Streptomyces sp. NRRL F-5681]
MSTSADPPGDNDQATPEDGGPPSFAETTRNWYEKHKPKIRAVGAVGLAVVIGVAVVIANLPDGEDNEVIEDSEPASALETIDEPRRSPSAYDVDGFLRKLPEGQRASEAKQARYQEEMGEELPPGYTFVDPWSFSGDSAEQDGEPDQSAA